ncbi:MAG: transposase [Candidatus Aenigmatarchaeota archaeon]
MSIIKTRRRYTREFKLDAIQLVANRDGKIAQVAESLGIHPNILHRWIKEHADDPSNAFPGNGKLKTPDEEIRQLKKQLREAEEERDILKKALAIFSKKKI